MTTFRKVVLANNEIYHIYNRSIDRKPIFTDKNSCARALLTIQYYRFDNLPIRLSKILTLPVDQRQYIFKDIAKDENKLVDIIAFNMMSNHFHFEIQQMKDNGISRFLSNFTNSYTKFFNTRTERSGPLVEGAFKAVRVETDEQLIHLSRYIHLNPVTSFLVKNEDLENYPWSSLPEYLNQKENQFCNKQKILGFFHSVEDYKKFLFDQISYAQELDKIKHLIME